ncbi:MAG: hypothetical protein U5K75_00870 [Ahrensia sp.]|nr:hypothetical protein [Ahrensia sp.]
MVSPSSQIIHRLPFPNPPPLAHIGRMANRPPKKTGNPNAIDEAARPAKPSGMGEMPQAAFEGAPISGASITDWVRQLEEDAARQARTEETRDIRSKAGKHRRKVERDAAKEQSAEARTLTPSESGGKRKSSANKEASDKQPEDDRPSGLGG